LVIPHLLFGRNVAVQLAGIQKPGNEARLSSNALRISILRMRHVSLMALQAK
jgi:hypothetical protein